MATERTTLPDLIRLTTLALLAAVIACPATAASRATPKKATPTVTLDADGAIEHLRPGSLASFAPSLVNSGKFSFTAPGQSAASARMQTVERAFRFTPSGKSDSRRALSFGMTSRVVAPTVDTSKAAAVPAEVASLAPAAYNVDLAVGWRNFAVSGGYSRSDTLGGTLPTSLTPRRDAVDVGVSYRGASWKTSLQIASESGTPILLSPTPLDRQYSVELGAAYLLTPSLSLNGGVRYKQTGVTDPAFRDRGVYLGTALSF